MLLNMMADLWLVAENQTVAGTVDYDWFFAAHLFGQQRLTQIVENITLDGALYRTGTEFGVVANR